MTNVYVPGFNVFTSFPVALVSVIAYASFFPVTPISLVAAEPWAKAEPARRTAPTTAAAAAATTRLFFIGRAPLLGGSRLRVSARRRRVRVLLFRWRSGIEPRIGRTGPIVS